MNPFVWHRFARSTSIPSKISFSTLIFRSKSCLEVGAVNDDPSQQHLHKAYETASTVTHYRAGSKYNHIHKKSFHSSSHLYTVSTKGPGEWSDWENNAYDDDSGYEDDDSTLTDSFVTLSPGFLGVINSQNTTSIIEKAQNKVELAKDDWTGISEEPPYFGKLGLYTSLSQTAILQL